MNGENKELKGIHITVKSLTSGEVVLDKDCTAIVAGLVENGRSSSFIMTECDTISLIKCILSAESATKTASNKLSGHFADFLKEMSSKLNDGDE